MLSWGEGEGGGGLVELRSGVVLMDGKSGESVNLGLGHRLSWGYHWS